MIFPWEGHALRQCELQRVHYDKVLRYALGFHVEGLGLIVKDPKRIHNKDDAWLELQSWRRSMWEVHTSNARHTCPNVG